MGLFKRAAARGVAHELVRQGLVEFPSKEAMDEAADHVADVMPGPEVSDEAGHDPHQLAQVAQKLIEIGQALMAEASSYGMPGGAPGAGAGGLPPAVAEAKTASYRDLGDAAGAEALAVMQKTAAEVKAAGALIEGGDKGNDPSQAANTHEVAKLDEKQRPQGSYQVPMGDTALDTDKGQIGSSEKHDKTPAQTVSGTNSVNKSASWKDAVAKVASKLVGLHAPAEKQNTPQSAAETDEVAKLDQKQRPQGKYTVAPGGANFKEPQAARIGTEQPHPSAPKNSPSGTNSVIQASKAASELSDDDKIFVELFKKTAADVGEYLPVKLTEAEKVAEIRKMIGLTHNERQERINELHKVAGDLKDMVAAMKGSEAEAKGEKKDEREKKDEEKKGSENPLLSEIRRIANEATAPRA